MRVVKDPNAVKDYGLNWSQWLGTDTIATSTWVVPAGLTQPIPATNTTTVTTVWLGGGTAGETYQVTNRITTAAGRVEDQTLTIMVRDK